MNFFPQIWKKSATKEHTGRQVHMPRCSRLKRKGFTLAELLIALLILGEIATFTIPKIINSQTNARNNAIAKETMATLAAAYQQLQMRTTGSLPTTTTVGAVTQYMNYIAADSSSSIDSYPGVAPQTFSCATFPCIRLHNGGLLMLDITTFASTGGATGWVDAILDQDGTVTSKGDSIVFILSYNGRIQQYGDYLGSSAYTPAWFSY